MNYRTPLITCTWFIKRTRRYLVSPPAVWRELWPRPRLRWCSLTGFCLKRMIAWSQTRIHQKRRVLEAKMWVLPQACPYAAAWTNRHVQRRRQVTGDLGLLLHLLERHRQILLHWERRLWERERKYISQSLPVQPGSVLWTSLNTSEMIWEMPDLIIVITGLWLIWIFKRICVLD